MRSLLVGLLIGTLPLAAPSEYARAQSPTPIVVQAATPPSPATSAPAPAPKTPDNDAAMKTLQHLKAGNDEILKKQEATLQRLDELQKAADQLKVFSKRG